MDMTTNSTAMAPPANTTSSGGMGGMGGMGGGCKISMLWNWYTIDSCFIASSWRITSEGMFAGSCIGVILLVMSLEFLRRSVKEYDRFLLRQHASANPSKTGSGSPTPVAPFRPNFFQQAIRAFLHMVQFAVAYFVMLLAMYYNGYIIICIFIGSYLGAFVFHWETFTPGWVRPSRNRTPEEEPLLIHSCSGDQTSAAREATVCCG
ncbi:hypothetical protein RB601_002965 [Gaeumannomyces tritici]